MTIDEIRDNFKELVLEIRQYLLNTEFAPEPFKKPMDTKMLTEVFPQKFLSTEIVPERECPWCKDSDELLKIDCPYHCIANRLPPVTVEQAIKKVMECQLK